MTAPNSDRNNACSTSAALAIESGSAVLEPRK